MKAIVIAAGQGSRLLPLTLSRPKCLVEVGGRPILDQQLEAARAAGMTGALVVGGYRIEQIAAHLARHDFGMAVSLVFNPFWAVASSIGSVWAARAALDQPFALMNGDTLFDPAIVAAAVAHPAGDVKLVVDMLGEPEPDDMLVAVENGQVCDVGKRLPLVHATHRSLGLVVSAGGTAYADALRHVIGQDDGIHAYHHAIVAHLARTTGVAAVPIDRAAHWQEIDRPDDIARWRLDHEASDGVA